MILREAWILPIVAGLLSLSACGSGGGESNDGPVALSNDGPVALSNVSGSANSNSPAAPITPVASTAGVECATLGSPDQVLSGVFKWGVPLEEAVRRLKCSGFDVGDIYVPDARFKGSQVNEMDAASQQARFKLSYTGLPGKQQVIRVQQTINLREDSGLRLGAAIAELERRYGAFVVAPSQPTDRHAGMIARDVDVAAAGGNNKWAARCFQARAQSPNSIDACGETLIYEIHTYPKSNAVRQFVLTLDNHRQTKRLVAQLAEVRDQFYVKQEQERNSVVGANGLTAEAAEMVKLCSINVYQNRYFKCECLGREFQRVRSEKGANVPHHEIFETITNSAEVEPSCANSEAIRQSASRSCSGFVAGYEMAPSELKTAKAKYCSCVGNKMAGDFGAQPRLSSQYVETLRYNAMNECQKPASRDRINAAAR